MPGESGYLLFACNDCRNNSMKLIKSIPIIIHIWRCISLFYENNPVHCCTPRNKSKFTDAPSVLFLFFFLLSLSFL